MIPNNINLLTMLFVFYIYVLLVLSNVNGIQIETLQGNIIGITRKILSREIHEFLGIPYAKPPIGELRFKNPVPFGPWKGVKNATQDGSPCLQYHFFAQPHVPVVLGLEDCLYLNVYTPSVAEQTKYPVMVFIHGGAFITGSGSSGIFGPDFILEKDVVLVVINYRLGALGFASTEDNEMSGNWGLKDQNLALKWVHDNIAAYGGNPNSVTIFGQSAGSSSVHYHTISPLSKGLFHGAIAMSGSAHCVYCRKWPGEIAKRTKMMASSLKCPTNTSKLLVDCLRKVSPERFILLNENITEKYENAAFMIFTPVVEQLGVDGAFITDDPLALTSSVPLIIGTTKDEGSFLVYLFQMKTTIEDLLSQIDKDFQKIVPPTMAYDNEGQDTSSMMKEIQKFYFGQKKINLTVIQDVITMYTDSWFLQCTTSAVRSHKGPVYLYLFTHKGAYSLTQLMPRNHEIDYGVTHGDDLFYVFPYRRDSLVNMTMRDQKMINDMVSLWTNFAIYGNPTPKNSSEVIWNEVSATGLNYLDINSDNMTMVNNLFPDRVNFWLQFEPKQTSSANKINLASYASILLLIFRFFIH